MVLWVLGAIACLSAGPALPAPPSQPDGELKQLHDLQQAFQRVVAKIEPSVVAIRSLRRTGSKDTSTGEPECQHIEDSPIWSAGSGLVLRSDGLILTNEHVTRSAERVMVVLSGGATHTARIVAIDQPNDLAIVEIDERHLPVAPLGDASNLRVGSWVVALGNPYGLSLDGRMSVSVGVVSALGRSLARLDLAERREYRDMIQTTAAINPGHSGGPLVDLGGRVIGLNTAMFSRTGLSEGVGFAIPINAHTKLLLTRLLTDRIAGCGYLGIWATEQEAGYSLPASISSDRAVRVWRVDPQSPAQRAGMRAGDIILRFNATEVTHAEQLARLISQARPGGLACVSLHRDHRHVTVEMRVGTLQPPGKMAGHVSTDQAHLGSNPASRLRAGLE
jgi:serine protease Do